MTDSMKFGPEWLRNMASDGTQVAPPKYQLADHRYGREEMLALFDRMVKAPDPLNGIPALYVEKTQQPLALVQMTDEETRMWNRGVNSDAVLRLNGKMPAPTAEPRIVSLGREPGRGRGGSVDRGRGRGRGGQGYYNRGLSYEEAGDALQEKSAGFIRSNSRPFERPNNMSSERGWGERNGTDPSDWNGSTSPRKGGMETNWRRSRGGGEDDDGWRTQPTSKWARPSSWREGDKEGGESGGRWEPGSRAHRSWDTDRHHMDPDNLPEWAMENPGESGSFDASGAFHGGTGSDDDQDTAVSIGTIKERKSSESPSAGKPSDPTKKPGPAVGQPVNPPSQSPVNHSSSAPVPKVQSSSTVVGQSQPPHISKSQSASSVLASDPGADPPHLEKRTNHSPPGVKRSPSEQAISIPKQNVVNNGVTKSKNPTVSSSVINEASPAVTSNHFQTPLTNQLMDVLNSKFQEPSFDLNTQFQSAKVMRSSSSGFIPPPKSTGFAPPTSINNQFSAAQFIANSMYPGMSGKPMEDDRMQMHEEAVAKLTAEVPMPGSQSHDKWFYMDPQAEVQGPFAASEMDEWFKAGYFTVSLLVRRGCDERFSQLGELMKIWGRVPFLPGPNMPPLQSNSAEALPQTKPPPPDQEAILQQQFQFQQQQQLMQQQVLQKQMLVQKHMVHNQMSQTEWWSTLSPVDQHQMVSQQIMLQKQMVHNKMSQTERFNALSPMEQEQVVMQQVLMDPGSYIPPPPQPQPPPQLKNPMMQLISQMKAPLNEKSPSTYPLQQLIQQMGGMQNLSTAAVTSAPISQPTVSTAAIGSQSGQVGIKNEDPIHSLLRQLGASNKPQVDVWGNPFPAASWSQQGPTHPHPPGPPSQLPASMWDLQGKDMKTEQQIIEEQIRAEEEKRLEEALTREAEEKKKKRDEAKRKEAERQRLEEEKKKHEAEKTRKKAEEEKKKLEQKLEEQKRLEEELRKKEEKKKKEEEKKKKEEEKRKKEEEKERKRKLEEERKREEEEKKRLEEEAARKREEEEEQTRRQEQQRLALKRLQEKQQAVKQAPWSQQAPAVSGSLVDIQRQEKEKKEREAREQQALLQQLQLQQQQQQQQQLLAAANESKNSASLQLKWAERKPTPSRVQSLAEIQAEEARQAERERVERAVQQKEQAAVPPTAGIWSGASQLSWTTSNKGFWDDVPSAPTKPAPKVKTANHSSAATAAVPKTGQSKTRTKKDEAVVMKLFDNQRGDDFTQWCSNTLQSIQASVDIPTFANFLRDIESPYEVRDYVKMYLGEGKDAQEFARQFLERRSRWRSAQRAAPQHDDLAQPAPAINPAGQQDFQEVKGKGKKLKKNKMFRVDNRILGFSVTAAQDRINVGDRDYGEGV